VGKKSITFVMIVSVSLIKLLKLIKGKYALKLFQVVTSEKLSKKKLLKTKNTKKLFYKSNKYY